MPFPGTRINQETVAAECRRHAGCRVVLRGEVHRHEQAHRPDLGRRGRRRRRARHATRPAHAANAGSSSGSARPTTRSRRKRPSRWPTRSGRTRRRAAAAAAGPERAAAATATRTRRRRTRTHPPPPRPGSGWPCRSHPSSAGDAAAVLTAGGRRERTRMPNASVGVYGPTHGGCAVADVDVRNSAAAGAAEPERLLRSGSAGSCRQERSVRRRSVPPPHGVHPAWHPAFAGAAKAIAIRWPPKTLIASATSAFISSSSPSGPGPRCTGTVSWLAKRPAVLFQVMPS